MYSQSWVGHSLLKLPWLVLLLAFGTQRKWSDQDVCPSEWPRPQKDLANAVTS